MDDKLSRCGPLRFAFHFYKPQWFLILCSVPLLVAASVLQLMLPFYLQMMTNFDDDSKRNVIQEVIAQFNEEHIVPILSPYCAVYAPSMDARLCGVTVLLLFTLTVYFIVSYYKKMLVVRLCLRCRVGLIENVVTDILNSGSPERVAAFESEQFSTLISRSAECLFSFLQVALMELFTNMTIAAGLIFILYWFFRSLVVATIKMLIPVGIIVVVQSFSGSKARRLGMTSHLKESAAKAEHHNIIQRAELVKNTNCAVFLAKRLDEKIKETEYANNAYDFNVHSAGAVMGSILNSVKIWLATILCVFQHKGWVDAGEVNLYLMLISWSFSCLKSFFREKDHLQVQVAGVRLIQEVRTWVMHPELDEEERKRERKRKRRQEENAARSPLSPVRLWNALDLKAGRDGKDDEDDFPKLPCKVEISQDDTADVSLEGVTFCYPQPPESLAQFRRPTYAPCKALSWKAKAHQITALYGPSGCGKSSSLRLLCGLLKPSSGTIRTHADARMLEQQHSMVFGSVAENILLERIAERGSKDKESAGLYVKQHTLLEDAMKKAGCDGFVKDPFNYFIDNADNPPFSGGQQQRLRLARVFADGHRCSLVLFDEPTTGLDDVSVELVLASIKELRDVHNKTVIVATHDPRVAAISDQVIKLSVKNEE